MINMDDSTIRSPFSPEHYAAISDAVKCLTSVLGGCSLADRVRIVGMLDRLTATLLIENMRLPPDERSRQLAELRAWNAARYADR